MAKPIFIIKVPVDEFVNLSASIGKLKENMKTLYRDYHLMFVPSKNPEWQFECYNSTEAGNINFQELQDRVMELTELALAP